jgi:hypothetical protein
MEEIYIKNNLIKLKQFQIYKLIKNNLYIYFHRYIYK